MFKFFRSFLVATCFLAPSQLIADSLVDLDSEIKTLSTEIQLIDNGGAVMIRSLEAIDSIGLKTQLDKYEKYIDSVTHNTSQPVVRWYGAGQLFLLYKSYELWSANDSLSLQPVADRLLNKYFGNESCETVLNCGALVRSLAEFASFSPEAVMNQAKKISLKIASFPSSHLRTAAYFQAQAVAEICRVILKFKLTSQDAKGKLLRVSSSEIEYTRSQLVILTENLNEISLVIDSKNESDLVLNNFNKSIKSSLDKSRELVLGILIYLKRFESNDVTLFFNSIRGEESSFVKSGDAEAIAHALTLFSKHEMLLPGRHAWASFTEKFIETHLKDNVYFKNQLLLMSAQSKIVDETLSKLLSQHELPLTLLQQEENISKRFSQFYSLFHQIFKLEGDWLKFMASYRNYQDVLKQSYSDNIGDVQELRKKTMEQTYVFNITSMQTWLELNCYQYRVVGLRQNDYVKYKFDFQEKKIDLSSVCKQNEFNSAGNDIEVPVNTYIGSRLNYNTSLNAFSEALENPVVNALMMIATQQITNVLLVKSVSKITPAINSVAGDLYSYSLARKVAFEAFLEAGATTTVGEVNQTVSRVQKSFLVEKYFPLTLSNFLNKPSLAKVSDFLIHKVAASVYFAAVSKVLTSTVTLGYVPVYDFNQSVWNNIGSEILSGIFIFTVTPWMSQKTVNFIENRPEFGTFSPRKQVFLKGMGGVISDTAAFTAIPFIHRAVDKFSINKDGKEAPPIWQGAANLSSQVLNSFVLGMAFKRAELLSGIEVKFKQKSGEIDSALLFNQSNSDSFKFLEAEEIRKEMTTGGDHSW